MKVLFATDAKGNAGPSNVNRELVANWPQEDEIVTLAGSTKQAEILDGIRKGASCDVVIFPGSGWVDIVLHVILARMGKPIVCFNHGYFPFENEINVLGYSERKVAAIEWHMRTADIIVANSQLQMRFVRDRLKDFSGRYAFVNLGIDFFKQAPVVRSNPHPVIAVSGGTRLIKANEVVARAVHILRARGFDCELRVYGRDYATNEELTAAFESGAAIHMGQVPQDEFIRQLGEVDVFVMDSRHESFGLSALDAIKAGCSLLLSRNCGVAGVLALKRCDIIENCESAIEVANGIQGLLACPNASRLYRSLDFASLSWEKTASKLRDIVVTCCL